MDVYEVSQYSPIYLFTGFEAFLISWHVICVQFITTDMLRWSGRQNYTSSCTVKHWSAYIICPPPPASSSYKWVGGGGAQHQQLLCILLVFDSSITVGKKHISVVFSLLNQGKPVASCETDPSSCDNFWLPWEVLRVCAVTSVRPAVRQKVHFNSSLFFSETVKSFKHYHHDNIHWASY